MKRLTINLSDDLHAILTEVSKREGYRSPSEAFQSFLRHWALSQQPHQLTGSWANLPGIERDRLDEGLRQLVESGKGKKGSAIYFEKACSCESPSETARVITSWTKKGDSMTVTSRFIPGPSCLQCDTPWWQVDAQDTQGLLGVGDNGSVTAGAGGGALR